MTTRRQWQLGLRALRYFTFHRWRIFGLLLIVAASTCAALLQVWPLAILVDSVLSPTPKSSLPYRAVSAIADEPVVQIILLAAAAAVLRIAVEILGMLQTMLRLKIAHEAIFQFRCDLFRKLQSLSLAYHQNRRQADVLYRLNEDTSSLQVLLNILVDTTSAALTVSAIFLIMLSSNIPLTLMSLSVAPLLLAINLRFARQMGARCRTAKELDSQYLFEVQRSMSTLPLMQAFCRERFEFGRFQRSAHGRNRAWEEFHWQAAAYRLCVGLVFGAGTAMLLGYGGYLAYQNQFVHPVPGGMTVGALVVFVTYLAMFYDPLCKLSGAGANLQTGLAGAERVLEVLEQEPTVREVPGAIRLAQQPRRLTLSHVGFAYSKRPVLHDIHATIEAGQMVAFVGPSGAGKSTLLNLLPRFYDPNEGSLLLDHHDLRTLSLGDLRKHIALVLQDGLILPTTIAENIAYAHPDATEPQIRQAAQAAGAASFIEALPDGYATLLCEGGRNLSGGQRQRIAIARALLTRAPILVFDEPTSALDAQNELMLTRTLNLLKGSRTLIIVSHRLTTIGNCDRIFVMCDGRIVEQGTHQELVRSGGLYSEMAQSQLVGDELPTAVAAA